MSVVELSPDMIWYACHGCKRNFTLADAKNGNACPHCGSTRFSHYSEDVTED